MKNGCPCQSGYEYSRCCEPFHRGKLAPTAEALMRSRYSAFAKGQVGHIVKTTHPKSPGINRNTTAWRKELKKYCKSTKFYGLTVLEAADESPTEATVKFKTLMMRKGQDVSFTEKSQFEKLNGRWLYIQPSTEQVPQS